jgi:predicted double-glycine peptidase
MSPIELAWLKTAGVAALAVLGVAGGWRCSRWRGRWWLIGYVVPLAIVMAISLSRWFPWLELRPPCRWIMAGRTEFALLALVYTLMLTTLVYRLRRRSEKVLLSVLMVACVISQSILAFLMPAFNYRQLTEIKTIVDGDGICIQSNNYTCGPAAAVTALRRIGIQAKEGDLDVLAHATQTTGTQPDVLCHAIRHRYGVPCRQVCFNDVSELRPHVPVVAVIKFALLTDHFVTVLDVTDTLVVVGDPLTGRVEMTHEQFAKRWRRCGIIFDPPPPRNSNTPQ